MSLLTRDEALAKVDAGIEPLASELISISESLGRVLAQDVAARLTQPPQPVSSMDGYALNHKDVLSQPVTLTRIGQSQAGGPFEGSVSSGQCVRIFTGAAVPEGCDAVIIQEDCDVDGDQITMKEVAFEGKYVRRAGLDFSEGDVLLKAGTLITARHIGLLCSMNVPWVHVVRKPRVAILATGDELVMPGEAVHPSQIISSNSTMIGAMVRAMGAISVNLGIARDTDDSLKSMIAGLETCDILVTSGGISVGEYDLVRKVLGEAGLNIDFYKIAMKPGKPFMFGHIKGRPVMGLPGNPVSSYVTAFAFLRPALCKMQGLGFVKDRPVKAILGADVPPNAKRFEYMRAVFSENENGERVATPYDNQDSSMLGNLAHCEGFILRPIEAPAAKKGELVDVITIDDGMISV